ncbi:MAG: ZIP family metal transporter [Nanoarchaeota archaeon]|nr:ZIP family metal transporter [Nanoarchaeota archaeon]MBU1004329.1 ZIP family metal transporter [Nanoarchaeota archaeon]MBU1945453.1 ZIP family metal transporter [Nanoarchaeota archaeon]
MHLLLIIILATFIDSLTGLAGIFTLWMKPKLFKKILMSLVAFSTGALLSGAFFHLIPESLDKLTPIAAFTYVMIGFATFFLIERFLHWHHCHDGKCDVHPVSYLILVGDGIHNIIDGIIIGVSFFVSIPFGIITTLLIIGHEVPQELGNFGVLVYSGWTKKKSLIYNLIAQSTCILGGIISYFLSTSIEGIVPFILPFAAGGFIYIAASDLVPELHKEPDLKKSLISFSFFIIGILFMLAIKFIAEG